MKQWLERLTEAELPGGRFQVLTEKLGPVDALRFLALVSCEPFDYQQWRKEYFSATAWRNYWKRIRAHHEEKHS